MITAIVATNVICLPARLVGSPVCSKPSHPLAAYKFLGIEKNIYGKWKGKLMNHMTVGKSPSCYQGKQHATDTDSYTI
jgi:hypothetical protein